MQKWLDAGSGSCVFRERELRLVVENAILHFDRERYVVNASVVMPNHVHVLFMPLDGFSITDILRTWKGFTAREVNRALNRTGVFWQKESWDHLVRNERQFAKFVKYIRGNDAAKAYDAYETMRTDAERQS